MEVAMQLHKRVQKLEAKAGPAELLAVHLVGVMPGQTEEQACASYGLPIGHDDMVIFLIGQQPTQQEQVQ
jgi:hypothetical protein